MVAIPSGFGSTFKGHNTWTYLCTICTTCIHDPQHNSSGIGKPSEDSAKRKQKLIVINSPSSPRQELAFPEPQQQPVVVVPPPPALVQDVFS